MANEFISREAAIKEFCDDCMDREWCKSNGDSCSRIKNINAVPAADVRPVVHAKWEQVMGKYDKLFRCSKCHFVPIEPHYFCQNCGADMREVRADGI